MNIWLGHLFNGEHVAPENKCIHLKNMKFSIKLKVNWHDSDFTYRIGLHMDKFLGKHVFINVGLLIDILFTMMNNLASYNMYICSKVRQYSAMWTWSTNTEPKVVKKYKARNKKICCLRQEYLPETNVLNVKLWELSWRSQVDLCQGQHSVYK